MDTIKLCCLVKTYSLCYYCNRKWCRECWFSIVTKWDDDNRCPVKNNLPDGRNHGGHATWDASYQPIWPEYVREYEEARI